MNKILPVFFLLLLSISSAFAADPNWSRTLQWPFTGREFSLTPPPGGCQISSGCFRVENWTSYWLSPGVEGEPNADPGNALVVDASGVVHGIYVGEYTLAGTYNDMEFGNIPAINGDFRPAIRPKTDNVSPKTYLTVDPGVTVLRADAIQFRADAKPQMAFDVGLGRVVSYTPGHGTVVKRCSTTNDVTDPTDTPWLAAFIAQHCY